MIFSSITFLYYFLPVSLALALLTRSSTAILLAVSLFFYAWGEGAYVLLLIASAVFNYAAGLAIVRGRDWGRGVLIFGILVNLAVLIYFKYAVFLIQTIGDVALRWQLGTVPPPPAIHLVLGVSFFTFQGISYLVDVYRRDVAPEASFWRFALYKAFFPQLIAGPIVRYRLVRRHLRRRRMTLRRVRFGVEIFILGLGQKVLIANTLALPADQIFALPPGELGWLLAWSGLLFYGLQIFFDFCGYSTMAVGLGLMLGIGLPRNFRYPYAAASVTEFWRRWHITLSRWFRDYVYVPLGGNRDGRLRTYRNLAIVFLLCGLWHGANWTFIVWGAIHGALLIVERATGFGRWCQRQAALGRAYAFTAVMLAWVPFRCETLAQSGAFYRALFGFGPADADPAPYFQYVSSTVLLALAVGLAIAWRWPRMIAGVLRPLWRQGVGTRRGAVALLAPASYARTAAIPLVLFLSTASLAAGSYNPFIYFRF